MIEIARFQPKWIRPMPGLVLLLALGSVAPLAAQTVLCEIVPVPVSAAVVGVPYSMQFIMSPDNMGPHTPSYFSQLVDWPMTVKARLVDDCGQAVTDASVVASFSNGDPGIALALSDSTKGIYSATWRPANTASSVTVTLRAVKSGMPAATRAFYGAVIDDPGAPIVTANGVINNLNPVLGAPVAPGTVAAIYGRNLAASTLQAASLPLPTSLGGTQVLIGGIAAPLFFVSPGQINVQIPPDLRTIPRPT